MLKRHPVHPLFLVVSILAILVMVISVVGCNSSTATTQPPSATKAAAPSATSVQVEPTQAEKPTAAAATQAQVEPTKPPQVSLTGFWRSKVTSKEVLVFEFQEGGKTIWHYRYNNGQKRDDSGSYTVTADKLSVDVTSPQELSFKLDGSTLTLTGADGKPMIFQKVDGVDKLPATASQDIKKDIVAKWTDPATQETMEFTADGKVTIVQQQNTLNGTYTLSGSKLDMKLADQEKVSSFTVEIDGGVLTLYAADGSFTDYVK
jgi:hypothetical protein